MVLFIISPSTCVVKADRLHCPLSFGMPIILLICYLLPDSLIHNRVTTNTFALPSPNAYNKAFPSIHASLLYNPWGSIPLPSSEVNLNILTSVMPYGNTSYAMDLDSLQLANTKFYYPNSETHSQQSII